MNNQLLDTYREDPDEIERIIRECKRETHISYAQDGNFFTPHLRGINHAELGRSKMISSPFTIVLEWLLLQYERLWYMMHELKRRIFPRTDTLYGTRTDTHLVGKLTFAGPRDMGVPIHHIRLEAWARTHWGSWRKLSNAVSDTTGQFDLPLDLRAARSWAVREIQVDIYQTTHIFFPEGRSEPREEVFECRKLPKSEITGMEYSLGILRLPLWEYRTDSTVPRVVVPTNDLDLPEKYSEGRLDAFYNQILPIELTKLQHMEQIRYAPETITLDTIQQDYPENLTCAIERKLPGYTRSDEWFGRRMMNGMNKGTFLPDPQEEGVYWIKYFGICGYDHNDKYALPTCRVKFSLSDTGLPLPLEIQLQGALNAYDRGPDKISVFTPNDQPNWDYAKRVVRTCGSVSTEVDEHFAGTHLNTEQYAIAAYRNLRLNPIATLLLPHLKEVSLIDHAADASLIRGFLPRATALSDRGLQDRIQDMMGVQDWKGWQPMTPISHAHYYARGEHLFWEVVGRYVDAFINTHLEKIKQHWFEIHRFSEDLVNHSVAVFGSGVTESADKDLLKERLEYYTLVYGYAPSGGRRTVGGTLRIVSPITGATSFGETGEADLRHLRDACCYIIMTATYRHTWINEHQYDDLGEIRYNCGGLRFGTRPEGVLLPESDPGIAPDLVIGTEMLWFTNFLSRTEYGFITRNEEEDVNPLFRKFLLEEEKKFARLGIDVHAIESRTNI